MPSGICKTWALPLRNSPLTGHAMWDFVATYLPRRISQILSIGSANRTSDFERYARRGPRLRDSAMGGTLLIGLPPSSSGASHWRIPSVAGLHPFTSNFLLVQWKLSRKSRILTWSSMSKKSAPVITSIRFHRYNPSYVILIRWWTRQIINPPKLTIRLGRKEKLFHAQDLTTKNYWKKADPLLN